MKTPLIILAALALCLSGCLSTNDLAGLNAGTVTAGELQQVVGLALSIGSIIWSQAHHAANPPASPPSPNNANHL